MRFGDAINHMQNGGKVQRHGWNGKGMFIFTIIEWEFNTDISGVDEIETMPFICMKTADNKLVPWLASQTDVLAEDWMAIRDD
ncbi:DUF2829 domain-containing protein [Shewanella baltica]|uniref:DUF2829 domain-containing protein n=1 Tax=Shewanella baltica TaxID=62322 RepID=UPI002872887C|nr:DUF2829 domain-containing protein [Shewanella baltica]MDR9768132.1 DUF2829 domain-containing protein [Shewanella baltica]